MKTRQIATIGLILATGVAAFEVPQSPIPSPNYDFRQFMDGNNAALEQERSETIRRIRAKDEAPSYEEMVRINGLFRDKAERVPSPRKKPARFSGDGAR